MRIITFIMFLLFLFTLEINAQEVVSAGGDNFSNSTLSVSWTIGEPISETYSAGSQILTQGFHQSKLSVIGIYDISSADMLISLFPNPTQDFVNLTVANYENLTFQLFSFDGKLVQTNKVLSEKTEIKMNNLSSATYFLKILKGNKLLKTYQIIKQ